MIYHSTHINKHVFQQTTKTMNLRNIHTSSNLSKNAPSCMKQGTGLCQLNSYGFAIWPTGWKIKQQHSVRENEWIWDLIIMGGPYKSGLTTSQKSSPKDAWTNRACAVFKKKLFQKLQHHYYFAHALLKIYFLQFHGTEMSSTLRRFKWIHLQMFLNKNSLTNDPWHSISLFSWKQYILQMFFCFVFTLG